MTFNNLQYVRLIQLSQFCHVILNHFAKTNDPSLAYVENASAGMALNITNIAEIKHCVSRTLFMRGSRKFCQRGSNLITFFYEGIEDPNITINVPSSARQRTPWPMMAQHYCWLGSLNVIFRPTGCDGDPDLDVESSRDVL